MRRLVEGVVKDGAEKQGKKITQSFHYLQVQNQLLTEENLGLREALNTKKKRKKKSKTLDLQQREEYHSGSVFWSPRKVREAQARESVRQQDEYEQKLQKARDGELKEAAT
jgi:hypothetical protein